jgi:hypothetical protein
MIQNVCTKAQVMDNKDNGCNSQNGIIPIDLSQDIKEGIFCKDILNEIGKKIT